MTRVSPSCRIFVVLVLLISPLLFSPLLAMAERPVISSCVASPSTVAPGGTATVVAKATSPSGLAMHYIFTVPSGGTIQGDGATATFTAGASAQGVVPILCEVRDSHDSWVRGRAWVKVVGAATAGAAAPKPTPAKPESVTAAVPAKVVPPAPSKPTPQPAPSKPAAAVPAATVVHPTPTPAVTAPAQTRSTPPPSTPPPSVPTPAPSRTVQQAQTTPAPQQVASTPQQVTPAPVQTAPVVSPAVPTPAPVQTSAEAAQPSADSAVPTEWVTQSKDGLIEYAVPQKMIVGRTSTVTVKIHGYSVATGAMKGGSLTAQYLKVLLIAEDSHGLKIVSQGNAAIQYVPRNKTTTWVWNVTPMAAANQKLQARVFEEYKSDTEQDVDGESYTVNVTKPSLLMLAKEAYFGDEDAWWKYWLPSGAVCFLLLWLLMRFLSPRERKPAGTVHNYEASDWL